VGLHINFFLWEKLPAQAILAARGTCDLMLLGLAWDSSLELAVRKLREAV
jgi:hypothetical protein